MHILHTIKVTCDWAENFARGLAENRLTFTEVEKESHSPESDEKMANARENFISGICRFSSAYQYIFLSWEQISRKTQRIRKHNFRRKIEDRKLMEKTSPILRIIADHSIDWRKFDEKYQQKKQHASSKINRTGPCKSRIFPVKHLLHIFKVICGKVQQYLRGVLGGNRVKVRRYFKASELVDRRH